MTDRLGDILTDQLDVVFCGINPGKGSAALGAPRFVAFLGKPGYSALSDQRQIAWGLQPQSLGAAAVWVLPNPCWRPYSLEPNIL
ncbi:uracil-DNA glycosylase family protein [Pseudomonas paralactis]|uniref:hypothetical protein n=1 Tax=Pseudomonas paralactis TaxID=1615673 RepID=UPI000708AAA2|nr:hypothetical protein [Pseudomonas paralactis]